MRRITTMHIFLILSLLTFVCACNLGENSSSDDDDDEGGTPMGDDDDEFWDDDASDDDIDDDDADDDVDDDDADDDLDDDLDDDADDDNWTDDDYTYEQQDLLIEMIEGGLPGRYGSAAVVGPDGELYTAATKGRFLIIYRNRDGIVDQQIIDSMTRFPDMVMDSTGNLHLSYLDSANGALYYANNAGGNWNISMIEEEVTESAPSIDIGPDDVPHIAYVSVGSQYQNGSDLMHAFKSGRGWTKESLFSGSVGEAKIAIDSGAKVHAICSVSSVTPNIRYFNNTNDTWTEEVIDVRVNALSYYDFFDIDIDIGPDDTPHVAYTLDDTMTEIFNFYTYYAKRVNGFWSKKLLSHAGPMAGFLSLTTLAVDEGGIVHVAFSFSDLLVYKTSRDNFLAIRYTDTWLNGPISLACDSDGNAYVNYPDGDPYRLVAVLVKPGGRQDIVLDDSGSLGTHMGFTLDDEENPHISYWQRQDSILRYAVNSSDDWSIQDVGAMYGNTGKTSVQIDPAGNTHISSFYLGDRQLRYYHNDSGEWEFDVIEEGDYYSHGSLALDSADTVYLAYEAYYEDALYVASNTGGSWDKEVITDVNAEGIGGHSITIDDSDIPHIATGIHILQPGFPGGLVYVKRDAKGWNTELVSSDLTFVYDSDIEIDSVGDIHMVGCGGADFGTDYSRLVYGIKSGDEWNSELLVDDSDIDSISACSLDVDEDGFVHMAYYAGDYYNSFYTTGSLRYLTNMSGQWTESIIDMGSGIGGYVGIGVGNDAKVQVGYSGEGAAWHATFPAGFSGM